MGTNLEPHQHSDERRLKTATYKSVARPTELWRRTTIATRRHLAGLLGTTVRSFDRYHRLAYVKVVEYQARGLIHIHALIRLDPIATSPTPTDSAALAAAVVAAVTKASAPNPIPRGPAIRWGTRNQVDVVAVDGRQCLAGYLAKYTVKSVDAGGALDHRLHRAELDRLVLDDHLYRLVKTCWDLGGDARLADCRLREWTHALGFRGHWLTKSPNWSTSLTSLRQARHDYQLVRAGTRPEGIVLAEWKYAGSGHLNEGDAWLARSEARSRYLDRRTAWEER